MAFVSITATIQRSFNFNVISSNGPTSKLSFAIVDAPVARDNVTSPQPQGIIVNTFTSLVFVGSQQGIWL